MYHLSYIFLGIDECIIQSLCYEIYLKTFDMDSILRVSSILKGKESGKTIMRASIKPATNESQKTLNKCETRNKTVFHTRLRHPETINSVPLNSVLRIKQIGV